MPKGDSKGRPRFCVDIGAPRSVIGRKELNRILAQVGRHSIPDAIYSSLGSVELPIATPDCIPLIYVNLYIVSADVPALVGLDILDRESPFEDTVANRLV